MAMKRNAAVKRAVQVLQRSISCSKNRSPFLSNGIVPKDVKEGHFVVIAVCDEKPPKRFVVSLSCLSHPLFLNLLELAADEFGFRHDGALAVPCRPCEFERIINQM
ncbi:auxin-responsive protein SAUR50-like [Ananas comosus]|uniref:Auxin-responsive protein SAUR50-like n=1 Tax=Ananas comosus TaxID=4615 RepID=A0A6P5GXM3_ANACO|nr:auxin-responsive protein SAUR50-like [Ananas comosus]